MRLYAVKANIANQVSDFMARDYYQILGVSRNATKEEIKSAFRKLAKQYHPSVNPEPTAEQKFMEINGAYQVLSDDDKRKYYDLHGHEPGIGAANTADITGFEDIFDEFLKGFSQSAGSKSSKQKGIDALAGITLEEVAAGVEKEVYFNRQITCDACDGSGAEPGSKAKTCSICAGSGEVRMVQKTFIGQVVRVQNCKVCDGKGKLIIEQCRVCKGEGSRSKRASHHVKIPAGAPDGLRIQVKAENIFKDDDATRDLFIEVHVHRHQIFERQNKDILYTLVISREQAQQGDKIKVPTLGGQWELVIPPNTIHGQVLRLYGAGLPEFNSSSKDKHGDQLVKIKVGGTNITDTANNLIQKLSDTLNPFKKK